MRVWIEWAEAYWDVVAIAAAVASAVAVGATMAVSFNVIATRLDATQAQISPAVSAPLSDARSVPGDAPGS